MNSKQIALAIIFLISSPFAIGAPYDLFDEKQNNLSDLGMIWPSNKTLNSPFFNINLFEQQETVYNKQTYFEALNLLKNNQLEDAENKINFLILQNPKEPEFINLLALLNTIRKDNDLAIKNYQKAIKLSQKNLKANLGLAQLFINTGDLTQAKEHANVALSSNDKLIQAYFVLADIANKKNQQQKVENILLNAMNKIQGDIKLELAVANNLAKQYAALKRPKKILSLAQDINRRHPENSEVLSFLAGTQLANNQNQAAEQTLYKLINQETHDIRHRLLLANLLISQPKKKKQLLKLLDESLLIAPNNPQVLIQKTTILTQLKHFPEALNTVKKIKRLDSETGIAGLLEGDIYLAQKKLDQALKTYQKAYKIKPYYKALNKIINILFAQGKQSDAIGFLNKELIRYPKNLTAHFKLASIYEQQKNISKTEQHYQIILEEQPNNVLVLNNLAWLYHQQNIPKALPLAEKAYQIAPQSAAVADTYATILVSQGNVRRGIEILEKATKQIPIAADIQFHLANAYALDGKQQRATEILNTIVNSEQKFSEKNAAIHLLKKLKKLKNN